MTDTLERATIEKYTLPHGYVLLRHYWFTQYGEIDETDVRWSVVREDGRMVGPVYVYEKLTMTEALVTWLAQLNEPRRDLVDSLTTWIMVMMQRTGGAK